MYRIIIILFFPVFLFGQNKIILKVPYLPVYIGQDTTPTNLIAGYGVLINESPPNTWTIKADTSKIATLYDVSQVDQSSTNEIQLIDTFEIFNTNQLKISISKDNQPSKIVTLPSGGTTETVSAGYGINVTQAGSNYTVKADTTKLATLYDISLLDQSATNELQTFSNTSNANTHTLTLSNNGGKFVIKEGTNIDLQTNLDTLTITASGGGTGTIDGTGVATRPAIWLDNNTLTTDPSFDWDNTNKTLILGTGTPSLTPSTLQLIDIPTTGQSLALFENQSTGSSHGIRIKGSTTNGSFTAINSTAGTTNNLIILNNNTSNTSLASAVYQNKTASSGGNAYYTAENTASESWSFGVKNSDSYGGRYVVSQSSSLTAADERLSIASGGRVRIKNLDTDLAPPVTSGTVKMVITDSNGDLSFGNINNIDSTIVTAGYGVSVSELNNNFTINADTTKLATLYDVSQVDQSNTNELQTFTNTSNATSHTLTLSNGGGSLILNEGSNISLTTVGNTVTISTPAIISDATVSEGYGINVIQNGTDWSVAVDTNEIATQNDISTFVSGSGSATRPAFWSANKTLSSDVNFDWNNTSKRLLVGPNTAAVTPNKMQVVGTGTTGEFIMHIENEANVTSTGGLNIFGSNTNTSFVGLNNNANTTGIVVLRNNNTNSTNGSASFNNIINSTSGNSYYTAEKSAGSSWSFGLKQSETYNGRFTISESSSLTAAGERFSIGIGGVVRVKSLDTDIAAPTTSGITKMVITDANGDLSYADITGGISGNGVTNYMPYWTSATNLGSSAISYGTNFVGLGFNVTPSSVTHAIHINNDALRLQGTSTIIDKFNSGGALNNVLAGTGGNGVEWKSLSSLGADMSTSNEIQNFSFQPKVGSSVTVADDLGSATYKFTEGSNITLTRSPGGQELIIASTGGGNTDLTYSGTVSPYTLNSSTGSDVTISQGSNITLTRAASDLNIAANPSNLTLSGTSSPYSLQSSTANSTAVTLAAGSNMTLSRSLNELTFNAANTNLSITGSSPSFVFNSSTGNDITFTAFNGINLSSLSSQTLDIGLQGNALGIHNIPDASLGYVIKSGTNSFTTRSLQAGAGISITNASGVSNASFISLRNMQAYRVSNDTETLYTSSQEVDNNITTSSYNGNATLFTTTSNPLTFVISETGNYNLNFSGNAKVSTSGSTVWGYISIRKNGSIVQGTKRYITGNEYQSIALSNILIDCLANDVIDVYFTKGTYDVFISDFQMTFRHGVSSN